RFDVAESQPVHFTHSTVCYKPLPLCMGGIMIEPKDTAKYLGLVLDRHLRWKEHTDKAISKGTSTLLAVARLTRPTFGMPHHYICQLFVSVVVPKMEYGLMVWYKPIYTSLDAKRQSGSVGLANCVGKVQRIAACLVTGGFKSTATDALEYHTFLPP
ncbi:hypothetical protein K439DRAFT_1261297, partial [Ramaria rubella]